MQLSTSHKPRKDLRRVVPQNEGQCGNRILSGALREGNMSQMRRKNSKRHWLQGRLIRCECLFIYITLWFNTGTRTARSLCNTQQTKKLQTSVPLIAIRLVVSWPSKFNFGNFEGRTSCSEPETSPGHHLDHILSLLGVPFTAEPTVKKLNLT